MSNEAITNIIYTLCAVLVLGAAAWGASRRAKAAGAKGPGAVVSLLIWVGLIALVAAIYFGVQFWGAVFSLTR